jgi:hypothetical protein
MAIKVNVVTHKDCTKMLFQAPFSAPFEVKTKNNGS